VEKPGNLAEFDTDAATLLSVSARVNLLGAARPSVCRKYNDGRAPLSRPGSFGKVKRRNPHGKNFREAQTLNLQDRRSEVETVFEVRKDIVRGGKNGVPDPEANPVLRTLVEKAKRDNVPSHVIEKAIQKAAGTTEMALLWPDVV
jgi:hypothetical protein